MHSEADGSTESVVVCKAGLFPLALAVQSMMQ